MAIAQVSSHHSQGGQMSLEDDDENYQKSIQEECPRRQSCVLQWTSR